MTVSVIGHSAKIEVITSVQRRRRWNGAEKMRMVEETYEPDATVSLVARRHGVAPNQLFTWRRLAAQGALTAAAAGEEVVPASEHRALQQQLRELHRLLGKKTLKVEILKEVLEQAGPKKDCCFAHRCQVRAVPGERDRLDYRDRALEPDGPDGAFDPKAAWPPGCPGRRASRPDQGRHRPDADLWLSPRPCHFAACRRGGGKSSRTEPQAGLAGHA
jgi:transposase